MQTKQEIIPSTRRRANGWQATLEFANGGIQAFRSLHHSHDEALKDAQGMLRARLRHPKHCIDDPAPNMLIEF